MQIGPDSPELTVVGRIPSGSNVVFLCTDSGGDRWVYKPVLGERPLHDFPDGSLAAREVASYLVSRALGWDLVPETRPVVGPGGIGMGQRWITEAAPAGGTDPVGVYPMTAVPPGHAKVVSGEDEDGNAVVVAHDLGERLRRIALFDHVINNADRKGGHLLTDSEGTIWAIDHGLALHREPKVRTVLWGWAGTPIDQSDVPALTALRKTLDPAEAPEAGDAAEAAVSAEAGESPLAPAGEQPGTLRSALGELLTPGEIEAITARIDQLLAGGTHPVPGPGYPLPWPLF